MDRTQTTKISEQEYIQNLISRLAEQLAHCLGGQLCLVKEARSFLEVKKHG